MGGHCALGWFQGGTRVGRSGHGCGCIAGKPSTEEGNLMCQSCRGKAKGRIAGKPSPGEGNLMCQSCGAVRASAGRRLFGDLVLGMEGGGRCHM